MNPNQTQKNGYLLPMIIIGALFFIFGFVTWLNGILIPFFKTTCGLTDLESTLVTFSFYISYTIVAIPASFLLNKTGIKNGMMIGLILMGVGAIFFIPASITRTYYVFLTGLFIMGAGLTILQTASNPYITIVGPRESAAKRISIMGVCNKLAGAMAPLILAYFALQDFDSFKASLVGLDETAKNIALDSLAQRLIAPYSIFALILILFGIYIKYSPLPNIEVEQEKDREDTSDLFSNKTSILQFPQLILGAIALFFYVGAEVIAGDLIIRYGNSLGIEMSMAKTFTSFVLISMVVGYIIGIVLIPKVISQRNALKYSSILGIILTSCILIFKGQTSVFFVAILGLANALVWPAIWPLAIHDLGKFIKTGSAILIMAIAGGALLPLAWGKLSDLYSPQTAYVILFPSYLIILYYSVWGYRLRNWR